MEDGGSLKDLLQGAENIVYEARDDATNISFVMNGRRKWVPVVVTKLRGGEMNAAKWINVRGQPLLFDPARKVAVSKTHSQKNTLPTS